MIYIQLLRSSFFRDVALCHWVKKLCVYISAVEDDTTTLSRNVETWATKRPMTQRQVSEERGS